MENLNKQNFWNELNEKCPAVMAKFCKFIDEYKRKNDWKLMFKSRIKFHDIPVEMQTGIVVKFIMEITNQNAEQLQNSKTYITQEFMHIEKKLKQLN